MQRHVVGELGLSFRYESRTPEKKARVAVVLANEHDGYTFEISSLDSGWSSGLVPLKNKSLVTVPLHKRGENKFVVKVFDCGGGRFESGRTIFALQRYNNFQAMTALKLCDKKFSLLDKGRTFFDVQTRLQLKNFFNVAARQLFPRFQSGGRRVLREFLFA